jgi:hypothetical protein
MHTLTSSFILGYHGCDAGVAESILSGDDFIPSENDYDRLGHGIYFWESNPKRGLEFAQEVAASPRPGTKIKAPAVVGAIIDLGLCLDLTTLSGVSEVKAAYHAFVELIRASDSLAIPTNSKDKLRRSLDCAVINTLCDIRMTSGQAPIDTVKGVFLEGGPIYPDAGILEKTHIQICVRNHGCIKGVFRVRDADITG